MNPSERIKELKINSTLWTDPKRMINFVDFDPKKISIYTELNSISNTPGYFNVDDNVGSTLNTILTDDQKNKISSNMERNF